MERKLPENEGHREESRWEKRGVTLPTVMSECLIQPFLMLELVLNFPVMRTKKYTFFPFYFILLLKPFSTEVLLLSSVTEVMGIVRDFLLSLLIQLSTLSFPLHGLSAYLTLK